MENLQKIVVLCLFVALVVFLVITGIQKVKTHEVNYDPGPQVPVEQIDPPSLEIETGPEDATEDPVLKEGDVDDTATLPETGDEVLVACTADAKICPDGSGVGRTGPNCEFEACPIQTISVSRLCTDAQKRAEICTMEYAPVCGLVDVQCVTTPCNSIPQTFGNACGACAQGNVVSYSEGECILQ